jgi:diguanylate cyclase (GGDEF)-like protein
MKDSRSSAGADRGPLDELNLLIEKVRVHMATQDRPFLLSEEKRRLQRENEKLRKMHFITLEYASMIENELLDRIRKLSEAWTRGSSSDLESAEAETLRAENGRLMLEVEKLNVIIATLFSRDSSAEGQLDPRLRETGELAYRDPLTRLYNRRKISEALVYEYSAMNEKGQPLSLIKFDIDHFKAINDSHGYDTGNRVLLDIARTVSAALPPKTVFARWGGEEFMIIEPGHPLEGAASVAETLRLLIRESRPAGMDRVTCSFGVIEVAAYEEPQSILKRLDACVYKAKEEGRDRVCSEIREEKNGHYDE